MLETRIVRMGVGYDRLDRVALAKRGVTVCNVPGSFTPSFNMSYERPPLEKAQGES